MEKSVRVSGITLASVFHDIMECLGDVEGLLLGKVTQKVVHVIEDDIEVTHLTYYVDITNFLNLRQLFTFYDVHGHLDLKKWSMLYQGSYTVLGWFRSRKHLPPRPTLRDIQIYKELLNHWKSLEDPVLKVIQPLLTVFSVVEKTTYMDFEYKVFEMGKQGTFLEVPISTINLVNSTSTEYEELSTTLLTPQKDNTSDLLSEKLLHSFEKIAQPVAIPPENIVAFEKVFKDVLEGMASLAKEIQTYEEEIVQLES